MYKWSEKDDIPGPSSSEEFTLISKEDLECLKVLRSPADPSSNPDPVSPDVVKYTLIAAVITAILVYAAFLISKLADTVIRGEESAKTLVGETIIGDVPNWTNSAAAAKEENKK